MFLINTIFHSFEPLRYGNNKPYALSTRNRKCSNKMDHTWEALRNKVKKFKLNLSENYSKSTEIAIPARNFLNFFRGSMPSDPQQNLFCFAINSKLISSTIRNSKYSYPIVTSSFLKVTCPPLLLGKQLFQVLTKLSTVTKSYGNGNTALCIDVQNIISLCVLQGHFFNITLTQSRRQSSRLMRAKRLSGGEGGQTLKLSAKAAAFKKLSFLIG